MASTWNQQRFLLLPKDSYISWLIARHEHERGGHLGVAASISKVRAKYWITGVRRMMKDVIRKCRHCKEKLKAKQTQVMSPLPVERIKPSPAFNTVGVDYFGPFATKGEVQKRIRGKSYGVIFTCFSSRAVYVDVAHDAATDGFLQVLRRFVSLRGWPSKFYSDNGTQLVGASNEMKEIVRNLGWNEIKKFGQPFDSEWEFAPPDGQWYNGATESLVKSVKRALGAAIGENVLQFSELQTCMFEAAELVNERPIGAHPDSPEDGVYLCPNDLILGRASNKVPHGPFMERTSDKHRFDFLQKVVTAFWKRWNRDVFPNMVMEPKWHVEQRNLKEGDVVLVQDANPVRGRWKMALVESPIISEDGKVRRVEISYKSLEGTRITVERPVQRLIVLVPNENYRPGVFYISSNVKLRKPSESPTADSPTARSPTANTKAERKPNASRQPTADSREPHPEAVETPTRRAALDTPTLQSSTLQYEHSLVSPPQLLVNSIYAVGRSSNDGRKCSNMAMYTSLMILLNC